MQDQTLRILTVVGARPQFIKAAMVSRAILQHNEAGKGPQITEEIIHTGQHYDENLSQVFFDQMKIPRPTANLQIGGGSHGDMTGRMLIRLEEEMLSRKPDRVLVYGDTNSTLAGALAATKLHIPVAHVEAGLRSFNMKMPEEVNRILTDRVSDLLLCPTASAIENLKKEGVTSGVHHVGDVMYDAAKVFGEIAKKQSDLLSRLSLTPKDFCLATVHRAENTDDRARLTGILQALSEISSRTPVILPLHPRTRKCIDEHNLSSVAEAITLIDPVSFLDMVQLEQNAKMILTDSGGVQKEAYFHSVPCITLRDETEWVETVEAGWNQVVGADRQAILQAAENACTGGLIKEYGEGDASGLVVGCLAG